MLSRPQFVVSNGRIFWGCFFLMIGSFSFVGFVYAAVVSKLQPPSDNAIIRAIQNDWYVFLFKIFQLCRSSTSSVLVLLLRGTFDTSDPRCHSISSLVEHETVQACMIDFGVRFVRFNVTDLEQFECVLVLKKKMTVPLMKSTLKYLVGIKGPSGYGSKTTAQKIAQDCFFSMPKTQLNAIITEGATSGIGAETARVLAKNGLRIIIPARDLKKADDLKKSIQKECPKAEIIALEMDLSSLASIQRFSSEFSSLGLPLHILINNAGKYSPKLELSDDKIELTFATNYLGHFVLTQMLLEKMVETALESGIQGRIVNVSSVIHKWVKTKHFSFTELLNPKVYNGTYAYAQSKLANILHAKELARKLKARTANVSINAVHPGIIKTGIIRDHTSFITGMSFFLFFLIIITFGHLRLVLSSFVLSSLYGCLLVKKIMYVRTFSDSLYFVAAKLLKSTTQGAATTCYVALSPNISGLSGKYFSDCNESRCSGLADEENEAHRLWTQTHALVQRLLLQKASSPNVATSFA
ncbi:NAD(P)-binding Rossmann-fold superfamily protein [Striga asiatica]|uniref:NAD(P)-binding Rossmann-fold superfamily protein n=1 Tax=Striga asiatica TaxID=4170 RepID=A0A5A7R6X6_STRAF|nr:NAD(P)-binding Rossmann-fold superfamily protein [Striga asiatica]